jgi:alkylation response protein AidB-like acyl-CoA dehydrogenase
MDFTLNEGQRLLADTAERLAERVTPEAAWDSLANLGLLGLHVPERFGGISGDPLDAMIVMERFGRHSIGDSFVSTAIVAPLLIDRFGTEAQQQHFFPGILSGQNRWALAIHEDGGRYDLDHVTTRAKPENSGYVLRGGKVAVIGGDTASYFVTSARVSGPRTDEERISLFVVPSAAAGVHVDRFPNLDGSGSANVRFDRVAVGADALIGAEGRGHDMLEEALAHGVAALCAEAVGAMSRMAELTFDHLKTRRQFGQPLGRFQAVQHRAAEMLTAIEQSRSITFFAASQLSGGEGEQRGAAIAAAKSVVGRHSRFVAQQAVQLHGGIGVTEESPVGRHFKHLTCLDLMWGDSAHHSDVYGRQLRAGVRQNGAGEDSKRGREKVHT